MVSEGNKRIVVIKDIPSNFIEEAILILKNDNRNEPERQVVQDKGKKRPGNDFLVKEAEIIIENYIREHKLQAAARRGRELKKGFFGRLLTGKLLLGLFLAAGVLLFALLMIQIF